MPSMAASNKNLTILKACKLILDQLGIDRDGIFNNQTGLLMADFKARFCLPVKEYCLSCDFLDVEIFHCGLTSMPCLFVKVINRFLRDIKTTYMMIDTDGRTIINLKQPN